MISLDPRSTSSAQDNHRESKRPIVQNDSQLNSDSTDQSATNRKIGKDSASPQKVPRRVTAANLGRAPLLRLRVRRERAVRPGVRTRAEAYMGA